MANKEHLAILKKGVKAWNEWRKDNIKIRPDLTFAHLRGAYLFEANLFEANLSGANLGRANLRGAHLIGANLCGAELRGTHLPRVNLRGANLRLANLTLANLGDANLSGANLSMASLHGAELSGANLSRANLSRANLFTAHLQIADLIEANLSGANLGYANLSGANLSGADLSDVRLMRTVFGDVDLTEANGLDSCRHYGPSIVDHRTIQKSGNLPLNFLRGCGLPESLIEYLPSLLNEPLQFYSCFISYSHKDEKFAKRLHADLQDNGVRCWFAPEDMKIGDEMRSRIYEVIRIYDKLMLILSKESTRSSWVQKEVETAFEKEEKVKRKVLFPIRLVGFEELQKWERFDADTVKDLGTEVREYYIPDFRKWKNHDAFEKEFKKLLHDLKAEDKAP